MQSNWQQREGPLSCSPEAAGGSLNATHQEASRPPAESSKRKKAARARKKPPPHKATVPAWPIDLQQTVVADAVEA
jgi:hypothetical protein